MAPISRPPFEMGAPPSVGKICPCNTVGAIDQKPTLGDHVGQLRGPFPERRRRHRLGARGLGTEEAGAVAPRAQHQAPGLVHHGDGHRRAECLGLGLGRPHRRLGISSVSSIMELSRDNVVVS
jgi:hypothetical protein